MITGFSNSRSQAFLKKSGLAFLSVWFFYRPGKELIKREFSNNNAKKDSNMMVIADEICDNALDSMLDSEDDKLALKLSSYIQSNFLLI